MADWQYNVITTRESTDLIAQRMQQMDRDGWELLNCSTAYEPGRIAYTTWWRKEAQGPAPYVPPRPHEPIEPASPA
jgi:hypothetical protein